MAPSSISCRPTKLLSNTVLPDPLRPMMRLVRPVRNSTEMSFSTVRPSNDLTMF